VSWAKGDDLYDDRPKIRRAWRTSGYAVGLHWMAVTASCRHENDGLVDPEWLAGKLSVIPAKAGEQAVRALVELGLFEPLPAGETRTFTDRKGFTVTVGPLEEAAHIVHDYLEYQDSSAYLADRRRKDAERKARGGRATGSPDSERSPHGIPADSASPDPTRPLPTEGEGAGSAREPLAELVADVIAVLRQCTRLHVDQIGVENAIASWPGRDHVRAARTVVTWVSDPAFNTTNAAKLLGDALSKQTPQKTAAADAKQERTARRLAAVESLGGQT